MQSPVIDHGGQDSIDLQPGIETITDPVHGLHQESNAAQGEELGLQRDDDAVGGGQSVDGQQAQGGLAINQDGVVVVQDRADHPSQGLLASDLVDELNLGGGQVDVGRDDIEPLGSVG